MESLRVTTNAPAKINLTLIVTGRREDGYHTIDSIFVPISLADSLEIEIKRSNGIQVSCTCAGRPELDGRDNLAARAAVNYLERVGATAEVRIQIQKKVWAAAGLGGGSSDAAAVLNAMNRHLPRLLGEPGRTLSQEDLRDVGLALGADVPFFLNPIAQVARGIGEDLTPVVGLPQLFLVLVNPNRPVSTADVYRGLGLRKGTMQHGECGLEPFDGTLGDVARRIRNDLEPEATRICPQVAEAKRQLIDAGAVAAGMSGSGPTVFGLVRDGPHQASVAAKLSRISGFSLESCRSLA